MKRASRGPGMGRRFGPPLISIRHLCAVAALCCECWGARALAGGLEQTSIAGLSSGSDPGVLRLPFVDLAAHRAVQRNGDARQALEQNPLGLEAG